jgi:hypothetical protein
MTRALRTGDSGAALLMVLVAAAFVAALAFAVIVVSETEQRIEATFERTLKVRSSADAAATRVVADLAPVFDWTATLGGDSLGPVDAGSSVVTPMGTVVDLAAAGAEIQADSDARAAGALNRPIWRRVESGPLATLTGSTTAKTIDYVAVWIADDWWEVDNDPIADSNGVVLVHAEAWGVGGAHASVEVTVAHGPVGPTCGMTARSDYVSGPPGRRVRTTPAVFARKWADPAPGIVLAAWQASDPGDPCHLHGPGAIMVTWREMS